VGYNYVVFGAGKVGQAVIYDLVENCEAECITVVDPDWEAHKHLEVFGSIVQPATHINPECYHEYEWDVAISCAPYSVNPSLCQECVEAEIPFLDLGGNPESFEAIQDICQKFNVQTPVITDCGLAPGICNMFAAYLAGRYGCKDINIICGGIPKHRPNNNVQHISAFSPEGLRSEYTGLCPHICNGKIVFEEAMYLITPYGLEYEAFATSNNSSFTAKYLHSLGVQNHRYQTLRWKGHANAMLEYQLTDIPFEDHQDMVFINVTGETSGRVTGFTARTLGADGLTAMARTTAVGITTVAHYVAKGGKTLSGFQTPEQLWSKHDLMNRLFEIFEIDAR